MQKFGFLLYHSFAAASTKNRFPANIHKSFGFVRFTDHSRLGYNERIAPLP